MSRRDSGPPGHQVGEGRSTREPANVEKEVVTTPPSPPALTRTDSRVHSTAWRRQCAADTVAGLHRRREASRRFVPLACGCPDPWPCRCSQPPLSDRALEAWADAVAHLGAHGLTAIAPPAVRQALYDLAGSVR
jgi:hypothetical protein